MIGPKWYSRSIFSRSRRMIGVIFSRAYNQVPCSSGGDSWFLQHSNLWHKPVPNPACVEPKFAIVNLLARIFSLPVLGTHPERHSPQMVSWFPLAIPIERPQHILAGENVKIHLWRVVDSHHVWYEWALTEPRPSRIHNAAGQAYKIALWRWSICFINWCICILHCSRNLPVKQCDRVGTHWITLNCIFVFVPKERLTAIGIASCSHRSGYRSIKSIAIIHIDNNRRNPVVHSSLWLPIWWPCIVLKRLRWIVCHGPRSFSPLKSIFILSILTSTTMILYMYDCLHRFTVYQNKTTPWRGLTCVLPLAK